MNLKQILITDTDNIKLDKVNYNFDQLVFNGGGPQGPQGSIGETGPIGITGAQGKVGPQGTTGPEGAIGVSGGVYWDKTNNTIYPLNNDPVYTNAPNVALGYLSNDDEYKNVNNKSVLTLNLKNNFASNLRLVHEDNNNTFDFKSDKGGENTIVTAKFNNISNNEFIQLADEFKFVSDGLDALHLDSDDLLLNVDTTFESNVTVDGTLKISSNNPGINKVAVSSDDIGTLAWKNINELGGTAPSGTIVSILPEIFDNNFMKNQVYEITDDDNDIIKFKVGKGLGEYVGWYICNGKTWTNGSDISYKTPELSSFSYEIKDNPNSSTDNSQGSVNKSNLPNIIGGSDIHMDASYNSSTYNITGTVTTGDVSISGGSDQAFVIKRLPQIIYLGIKDLYWEDNGNDQPPVEKDITYVFTDQGTIQKILTELKVVTDFPGTGGSFTIDINARDGWKWKSAPTLTLPQNHSSSSELINDNLTWRLTISYSSFPILGPIDITYNSDDHLIEIPGTTTTITFEVSLGGSHVQNATVDTSSTILATFSAEPGSSSTFNGATLDLGSNNGFKFVWGIDPTGPVNTFGSWASSTLGSDASSIGLNITKENPEETSAILIDGTYVFSSISWSFSVNSWPTENTTIQLYVESEATSEAPVVRFYWESGGQYPYIKTPGPQGFLKNIGIRRAYVGLELQSLYNPYDPDDPDSSLVVVGLGYGNTDVIEVENTNAYDSFYSGFASYNAGVTLSSGLTWNSEQVIKSTRINLSAPKLGWYSNTSLFEDEFVSFKYSDTNDPLSSQNPGSDVIAWDAAGDLPYEP